ncbi:MAG: SGNH/GDSL hydrolase family protein [Chitinophagaceae bacterium]
MKETKHIIRFAIAPLIFTILLPALFSCSKKNMSIPAPTDPSAKTYLALGDSYTIGQSVSETERFPNQAVSQLRALNIKINDPKIIATTGWTTKNLIDALNANTPANNFDVVSLLIGVNNQYQGRNMDEYKTEFTLLLNRSIQYAGNKPTHVFVLSIPDYSVTPFASGSDRARIAAEIDQFNSANRTISLQLGVNYLDITSISREADPSLIAGDGLHPSGKQYKRWADLLVPLMLHALQ